MGRLDVPSHLWRTYQPDHDAWVASATAILDLLARASGREDLGTASVLDVGCGTKLTKAVLELGVPMGRYVGIDTDAEVVDFLQQHVDDARFAFHHVDARNARYNTTGRRLADFESLPVDGERFDVVGLFSVFTHLDPNDYVAMLVLLRACAADDAHLVFSLYIDDGKSMTDLDRALARRLEAGDADLRRALVEKIEREGLDRSGVIPDFVDVQDELPLLRAQYSERYASQLFEGTGWEPVALHPPEEPYIQHYFVCRPV